MTLSRSLALAAALAASALPPQAQSPVVAPASFSAGVGIGDAGTGAAKFAFASTLVVPLDRGAVGFYVEAAETLEIFTSPSARNLVVGALAGTVIASETASLALLAGPTYTQRRTQGDRIVDASGGFTDRYEFQEHRGVGVMARAVWTSFPLPGVPVGARLEGGVNASTVGLTTSLVPGIAVRLGTRRAR